MTFKNVTDLNDISIEYKVDPINKVVIALGKIFVFEWGNCRSLIIAKAKARCADVDEFNEEYGKALARTRLLIKINKMQRGITTQAIEEQKEKLKTVCREMDKLNSNLHRYMRKLSELGVNN